MNAPLQSNAYGLAAADMRGGSGGYGGRSADAIARREIQERAMRLRQQGGASLLLRQQSHQMTLHGLARPAWGYRQPAGAMSRMLQDQATRVAMGGAISMTYGGGARPRGVDHSSECCLKPRAKKDLSRDNLGYLRVTH
jgi:hypothetical protein